MANTDYAASRGRSDADIFAAVTDLHRTFLSGDVNFPDRYCEACSKPGYMVVAPCPTMQIINRSRL